MDRPILFSGPMVRALIREIEQPGTGKTQTRRVLTPQPKTHRHCTVCGLGVGEWSACEEAECGELGPEVVATDTKVRFAVGDRLWVREAWRSAAPLDDTSPRDMEDLLFPPLHYEADGKAENWTEWRGHDVGRLRPGIHMPREFSRLTLTVTDVRVQRLQEISEADARAEGMPVDHNGDHYSPPSPEVDSWQGYGRASFSLLWNQLNAKRGFGWDSNPWVFAVTFTVHRGNIDQVQP